MLFLLVLSTTGLIAATTGPGEQGGRGAGCDACLHSQCYGKSVVHDGDISGQVAVDRNTNDLYYQFEDATGEYIQVSHNLDTNVRKTLPYIANYLPQIAVDQRTRDVYLGSSRGLYVYNSVSNATFFLGQSNINQLEFKDRLYFARLLYGLYFIEDGDVYYFNALKYTEIDDFVIDKNDDIFYRSGAKIYMFQHPDPIYLFTHRFAKLAVDSDGELYYSVFTNVFKYSYENGVFDSIGLVANSNMFTHVFDRNNNLVYYDITGPKRIYKLSKNEGVSCSVLNNQIIVQNSISESTNINK